MEADPSNSVGEEAGVSDIRHGGPKALSMRRQARDG